MASFSFTITKSGKSFEISVSSDKSWKSVGGAFKEILPAGQWFGSWEPEGGTERHAFYDTTKKPVFLLRNFDFPPIPDTNGPAYMSFISPLADYTGKWEYIGTEEDLVRLKEEAEKCRQELKAIVFQMGLDVAGVFDPSPISDIASAANQLRNNEVGGAVLSMIGVLPYVGDLAKALKVPGYVQRVAKLQHRLTTMLDKMRKIAKTLKQVKSVPRIRKLHKAFEAFASSNLAQIAKEIHSTLPTFANPRMLAKHKSAISRQALVAELESKGFVLVKRGKHGPISQLEDSDIYLRKVKKGDGSIEYESVRFDIRHADSSVDRRIDPKTGAFTQKSPGQVQGSGKTIARQHTPLSDSTVPPDKAAKLQSGELWRGDVTHWHRETFPATEGNLAVYLKPPRYDPVTKKTIFSSPPGLNKYDSTGQLANPSPYIPKPK